MSADEITCRQFVELLTDYFEGALDEPTLTQVEEHLVMCDWCVTYAEQMQATVGALRTLRDDAPPDWLQRAVTTAVRDGHRPPDGWCVIVYKFLRAGLSVYSAGSAGPGPSTNTR